MSAQIWPDLHQHDGPWWTRRWHWTVPVHTLDGPAAPIEGWAWTRAGALAAIRRAGRRAGVRGVS